MREFGICGLIGEGCQQITYRQKHTEARCIESFI